MRDSKTSTRLTLVLCTAAFCLAMGLREVVNIWLGTGVAAVVSLVLLRALAPESRPKAPGWSTRSVLVGLVAGVLMSIATWVAYPMSTDLLPAIGVEVPKLYALLRQPPGPVWAFPVLVLVVCTEELVWRGLGIDVFLDQGSETRAVVLATLLYVLPQIAFRSPLLVVVTLVCGAIWGALRVGTGGLTAPLVAHLTWDLLVFVLFPVA